MRECIQTKTSSLQVLRAPLLTHLCIMSIMFSKRRAFMARRCFVRLFCIAHRRVKVLVKRIMEAYRSLFRLNIPIFIHEISIFTFPQICWFSVKSSRFYPILTAFSREIRGKTKEISRTFLPHVSHSCPTHLPLMSH